MHNKKRHVLISLLLCKVLMLSVYSQPINELLRAGDEFYKIGNYEEAIEMWQKALSKNPTNKEAKQKLEQLYNEKLKSDKESVQKKLNDLSLKKQSLLQTPHKEITIEWEPVEGAIKYIIQIKDDMNKFIVDKTLTDNKIKVSMPPGKYSARVGAYNIFNKIGVWSDWQEINVIAKKAQTPSSLFSLTKHGFDFSIGYVYSHVFSDFKTLYQPTSHGIMIRGGCFFKDLTPFAKIPVVKNTKLEIEFGNREFFNSDSLSNVDMNLALQSISLNIVYCSNFSMPINYALRAGGGVVRSIQSIRILQPQMISELPPTITTVDPCYHIALSLLVDIGFSVYLEAGAGMLWVDYISLDLKATEIFCLLGMHI